MIRWRKQAGADVIDLFEHLLERNPTSARRIRDAIVAQMSLLAEYPAVIILRILHGARRWPDEPFTDS